MQRVRCRHTRRVLRPLVGTWFQELLSYPFCVSKFSTFPLVLVHYRSREYLALPDGQQIHAEFLVLRATQDTTRLRLASHTQLSCSMAVLSRTFCSLTFLPRRGPTATCRPTRWFGLFPVRSATTGMLFIFFPAGTKMFPVPPLHYIVEICLLRYRGVPFKIADQRSFAPTHPQLTRQLIILVSPLRVGASAMCYLLFVLTDHVWSIYTFSF